jgi:Tfp pilus assembly ATPase PilU
MQTFDQALLDLVVGGAVDRQTAANVAANRHDFLLALDHELKRRAVQGPEAEADTQPVAEAPFLRVRS